MHLLSPMRGRLGLVTLAGVASVCACACVDPGGAFDSFAARAGDRPAPEGGVVGDAGPCTVAPGSVSGQYLLALSVTLAPRKPIVSLLTVTTPEFMGGTGIAFDAQPLSAANRKTPVGDPVSLGPFAVGQTGTWRGDLSGLRVSGEANSITGGDITADVFLDGSLCGGGAFFCGTVSGSVTAPIPLDLAGSTFTLTRVNEAEDPPVTPAIDCASTPSDPP
jgi:hypothetical protein